MKFNDLAIESIAYELPPVAVSTEQLVRRLDPVLRRFKIPVDAMLQLTGIIERRFWANGHPMHQACLLYTSPSPRD